MTAADVGDRSDGWGDPEFSRQSSRHSVTREVQWSVFILPVVG